MRGDPAARSFSACYLREGELISIDTVNSPKDQMAARKLIAAHARPDVDQARRREHSPQRLLNPKRTTACIRW